MGALGQAVAKRAKEAGAHVTVLDIAQREQLIVLVDPGGLEPLLRVRDHLDLALV